MRFLFHHKSRFIIQLLVVTNDALHLQLCGYIRFISITQKHGGGHFIEVIFKKNTCLIVLFFNGIHIRLIYIKKKKVDDVPRSYSE